MKVVCDQLPESDSFDVKTINTVRPGTLLLLNQGLHLWEENTSNRTGLGNYLDALSKGERVLVLGDVPWHNPLAMIKVLTSKGLVGLVFCWGVEDSHG